MSAPAARRGFSAEAVTDLLERRAEPDWMRQRRQDAWQSYEQIPMPTRQDEEWRRTDLRGLRLNEIEPYGPSTAAGGPLLPESERDEKLAGFLGLRDAQVAEHRLADEWAARGVIFTDLATAVREHGDLVREHFMTRCVPAGDGKFAALHGAFWDNGTFLFVPRGVVIEEPFRVVIAAATPGRASLPHTLIVLSEGSQATFVEEVISAEHAPGEQQGFSSRVSELLLGPDAHLDYANVQHWGRSVYDFHTERALLDKDSTLVLHSIELGSLLSKGRVESIMQGPGSNARLIGLYFGDGRQHLDRYTLQDHAAPHATSDLLFKGVLTDRARSVYSGLIRVRPHAQKTDAYQQNRNLLLSRTARADSIPNLEIGANDVRCTHGATVGKVDEEELFYIMCRGLTRTDATRLIVEGFVDPQIEELPIAGLRQALRREIGARVVAGAPVATGAPAH